MQTENYTVLTHKTGNLLCEFIVKPEFIEGVTASFNYHFHSTFEVHVPVKGSLHILADDQDILLSPGEICIIAPDVVHYIYGNNDAYRIGFRFLFTGSGPLWQLFDRAFRQNRAAIFPSSIYHKYLATAGENFKTGQPDFMIAQLLFLALYDIATLQTASPIPYNIKSKHSDILLAERIEVYLNEHYTENISLSDLSNQLYLSHRQTERILNRLFSMNFRKLLNKKRLAAAQYLLRNSNYTIDQIATRSGFSDGCYFHRRFLSSFGTTPGSYRSQHKGNRI